MVNGKTLPQLPKISLGATGIEVSRLCLGGFHQVEISTDVITDVVDAFEAAGGNYIETARGYGRGASETKLGQVLKGRRDRFVLASKSGKRDADGIRRELEASLEALQTDHIEFYFFHGVSTMEDLDTITGKGGALEALLKAQDEGLITGMGFSSHRPPELYVEAMKRIPLSLILIWDNLLEEQYLPEIHAEVFPLAKEKQVGITVMKPLADGYLYETPETAMRYALGSGGDVMVCGMNSVEHVLTAAEAIAKGPATAEERAEILRTVPGLGKYVCRQCGKCSSKLMELFRLEGKVDRQMIDYLPHDPANYALRLRLHGWFNWAEETRQQFAQSDFDIEALKAEATGVVCPYEIDVARKLKLAVAKLEGENLQLL